jgi:hypothetical protein
MTKRETTFVGKIDLICYCWEYCRGDVDEFCERCSGL